MIDEIQLEFNVALRKESVDRNITRGQLPATEPPSLSARRAWIEIGLSGVDTVSHQVALRKESVDRNLAVWAIEHAYQRRSPQGERG